MEQSYRARMQNMRDYFAYLDELRLAELDLTLQSFGEYFRNKSVLDVGCGSGVQLSRLKGLACTAIGIERKDSIYAVRPDVAVKVYDGKILPFGSREFDVVYSSNVLEHVADQRALHSELLRVTVPGGVGVHVMPSHVWRLWSHVTHYPALVRKVSQYREMGCGVPRRMPAARKKRSAIRLLCNVCMDPPHGEFGNRFTEYFEFHPQAWLRRLAKYGWEIIDHRPTGLFYTGGALAGARLSLNARRRLAACLGSACYTYVVRKPYA